MAHPDLGRLIRNDFDTIYDGASVWRWRIDGKHQMLSRVVGGEAGLWQRVICQGDGEPL